MSGSKRPRSSSAITPITAGRSGGQTSPLETATEYELQRIIETSNDRDELAQVLRERDMRLRSRAYTREFWDAAFYQETRKLRDNLGGEFVTISRGTAVIGDYRLPHATVRRVKVTEPYSIGRFPITEGAYTKFCEDGGYQNEDYWSPIGWQWKARQSLVSPWLWRRYPYSTERSRHPMSGLTFFEAEAYCRWRTANEAGNAEIRLPSSEEWEVAARGRLGRSMPWGYALDPSRANLGGGKYERRQPVNRYPGGVSPFGAWDMVGNTWEVTADPLPDFDRALALFEQVSASIHETGTTHQSLRSALDLFPVHIHMHGCHYSVDWRDASAATERWSSPGERVRGLGFRVVRHPAID